MTTTTTVDIPIGTEVIAWSSDGVFTYGGPSRHAGMEQTAFSFQKPHPEHFTDPTRVAPADTPIPAADDRVQVTKYEGKKEYWMAGPWVLRVAGADKGTSFHKTKRDAVATGLRRVAILDFHAAAA